VLSTEWTKKLKCGYFINLKTMYLAEVSSKSPPMKVDQLSSLAVGKTVSEFGPIIVNFDKSVTIYVLASFVNSTLQVRS
jgi:hypothetical protein